MKKEFKIITVGLVAVIISFAFAACTQVSKPVKPDGTAWGSGAFGSNGERIYFTATSSRDAEISYTGGPTSIGMMANGRLTCASCHGAGGKGGKHEMGMNQVMDAKDIRWSALQSEFDAGKFALAVRKGQDPDGSLLKTDMPRWNIGDEDLADLVIYLKTLP
jgi:FlaG/FlaF family flagellin (archaellin)